MEIKGVSSKLGYANHRFVSRWQYRPRVALFLINRVERGNKASCLPSLKKKWEPKPADFAIYERTLYFCIFSGTSVKMPTAETISSSAFDLWFRWQSTALTVAHHSQTCILSFASSVTISVYASWNLSWTKKLWWAETNREQLQQHPKIEHFHNELTAQTQASSKTKSEQISTLFWWFMWTDSTQWHINRGPEEHR